MAPTFHDKKMRCVWYLGMMEGWPQSAVECTFDPGIPDLVKPVSQEAL